MGTDRSPDLPFQISKGRKEIRASARRKQRWHATYRLSVKEYGPVRLRKVLGGRWIRFVYGDATVPPEPGLAIPANYQRLDSHRESSLRSVPLVILNPAGLTYVRSHSYPPHTTKVGENPPSASVLADERDTLGYTLSHETWEDGPEGVVHRQPLAHLDEGWAKERWHLHKDCDWGAEQKAEIMGRYKRPEECAYLWADQEARDLVLSSVYHDINRPPPAVKKRSLFTSSYIPSIGESNRVFVLEAGERPKNECKLHGLALPCQHFACVPKAEQAKDEAHEDARAEAMKAKMEGDPEPMKTWLALDRVRRAEKTRERQADNNRRAVNAKEGHRSQFIDWD